MTVRNTPLVAVLAVAAAALLSAGSVFAQDATPDYARAQPAAGSATRAEVLADAAAFRASGQINPWSSKLSATTLRAPSTQARALVKAETRRALAAHEVDSHGEIFASHPARAAQVAAR